MKCICQPLHYLTFRTF